MWWPEKFILILFLSIFASQGRAQGLELKQLPEWIETRNPNVLKSKADLEAAEAEEDMATADFFPQILLKATRTHTDADITIDLPNQSIRRTLPNGAPFALDIDPPALKIQDQDVSKAQIVLMQPLYAGGRLSAQKDVRSADVRIREAENQMERNLQLQVVMQRYFRTLYGQEMVQILEQFSKHLQKIDQLTANLIKTGALPAFSRHKTTSALAELQARQVQASAQTEVVCRATQSLLGTQGPCVFKSPLTVLPLPTSPRSLHAVSEKSRPEYGILEQNRQKADAAFEAATGSLLPSVYAFGRRELLEGQLTALDPKWVVGVGLEWNLTGGLKGFPERKKAYAIKQKVEYAVQQAKRDIPIQIEQFWAQAKGEKAALDATRQAVKAAQETLRIQNIRFASGDASQFDVLSALSELEKLVIRELELKESYNRALVDLYAASGDVRLYIHHYHDHR